MCPTAQSGGRNRTRTIAPTRPRSSTSRTAPARARHGSAFRRHPASPLSVMADGIAARTGNCVNIQNNSCSRTECINPSRYPDDTRSGLGARRRVTLEWSTCSSSRTARSRESTHRTGCRSRSSRVLCHGLGRKRVERRPVPGRRPGGAGRDRRLLHRLRRAGRAGRRDVGLSPGRPHTVPRGARALGSRSRDDHARADRLVRRLVDEHERARLAVDGVGVDEQRAREAEPDACEVVERETVGRPVVQRPRRRAPRRPRRGSPATTASCA